MDKKNTDRGLFLTTIWIVITLLSFPAFVNTFDTELYESSRYIANITDYDTAFIHTSSFSYLPYLVFYPHNEHYLVTSLTEEEIFTAGGSVINPDDIKSNLSFVNETNQSFIAISEKRIFSSVILNQRGLYVTKR